MRISDWSSDVCSSDLQTDWSFADGLCHEEGRELIGSRCTLLQQNLTFLWERHHAGVARGQEPVRHEEEVETASVAHGFLVVVELEPTQTAEDGHAEALEEVQQIGRASGRERVCQYG